MNTPLLWAWLRHLRRRFGLGQGYDDLLATATWLLVAAGFVAVVVFPAFNFPVGPIGEVTGIVQGSAFDQNDGRASKVIYVRLPSSEVVTVVTCTDVVLPTGQPVQLLIYRRQLTHTHSYALKATMPSLQRRSC